jgi:hypothetical protein
LARLLSWPCHRNDGSGRETLGFRVEGDHEGKWEEDERSEKEKEAGEAGDAASQPEAFQISPFSPFFTGATFAARTL